MMIRYEYRAIPAPVRGDKEKGLKTGAARFAHAMEGALNEMGAEGWDYVRAETLPSEERSGLTGKSTVFHNLLLFRRPLAEAPAAVTPPPAPVAEKPEPQKVEEPKPAAAEPATIEPAATKPASAEPDKAPQPDQPT